MLEKKKTKKDEKEKYLRKTEERLKEIRNNSWQENQSLIIENHKQIDRYK